MKIQSNYRYCIAENDLREKAIQLHHKRYQEVGFFRREEQDPYETNAIYITALSDEDETVGVIRLIKGRLNELPTITHFQIYDLDRVKLEQLSAEAFAEVSAFTKLPQHDVGIGLLKAAYLYSIHNGITHLICCIDERVYKYVQRILHSPFKVVGQPRVYLGSNTIPTVLDLSAGAFNLSTSRRSLLQYFQSTDSAWMGVVNQ